MAYRKHLSVIKQELEKLSLPEYSTVRETVIREALSGHIIELERIIEEYYPELLRRFEKEGNALFNEKLSYPHKKLPENFESVCYSCLFWRQQIRNMNKKVAIASMKECLGFKSSVGHDSILLPITLRLECPHCCGRAEYICTQKEIFFQCGDCEHEEHFLNDSKGREFSKVSSIITCKCKVCKSIKKEVYENVQTAIRELIFEINKTFEKVFLDYQIDLVSQVSLRQQEIDYRLHASSLTKDERELISFHPENFEELLNILESINLQKKRSKKNYKFEVLKKLRQHGVIYIIRECEDLENAREVALINLFGRTHESLMNGWGGGISNADESRMHIKLLLETLSNGTYEEFYSRVTGNQNNFIASGTSDRRVTVVSFPNFFSEKKDLIVPTAEKTVFNKFYFNAPCIKPIGIYTKKLFNSGAEKSIFSVLRNQYPDMIIFPNKKLSDIIDISKIKSSFSSQEYDYLKNCIPDFCIYNLEGELLKVIELQKGEHHNSPEWIYKDNLKRRACKECGIDIEEKF